MITDNGVEILSKYLVGQASSYASHIAIGTGGRPTSNSQPINIIPPASTVTIAIVSAVEPFEATLTITGTGINDYWSYIKVGDVITGSQSNNSPTYNISGGTVTVKSINSPKQISVSSTSAMIAGTNVLSSVKASSSLTSQSLTGKTGLDFEFARFPIASRSYIVDKQTVSPSGLYITSPSTILVNIASGHPFGIGDEVTISEVKIPTIADPPDVFDVDVNGVYIITSISDSSFTAKVFPGVTTNWDSGMYTYQFIGMSYNNLLFNATVFTKQISLSSEMSDASRYEISELGLFSLGSNQYSASGNSRMLLTFSETEGWQSYDGTSFTDIVATTATSRPIGANPLFSSSTDSYWNGTYVALRQEKPRILNDGLVVPGGLSNFLSGTSFDGTSHYLLLQDPTIDLSKSSGSDEVRLAYSIMNAVDTPTALANAMYVMFEFTCANGVDTAKLLFSEINAGSTVIYPNRYNVLTKKISDFVTTSAFDWSKVTSVKVYCAIEASGTPTDEYAFVLDGLRFEDVGTQNPLYALTAYSVVNNPTATRVIKEANSNDLINFRLDLAVSK